MKYASFDHFFLILSNKLRVRTLQLLIQEGPQSVSAITKALKSDQTAVSHNLKKLLLCHFVTVQQTGKERIYSINEDTVKPLFEHIERHVSKYCVESCQHFEK